MIAPAGDLGAVIRLVGAAALAYWALDELVRGVNPWRRCLGGAVLAGLVFNLARTLL